MSSFNMLLFSFTLKLVLKVQNDFDPALKFFRQLMNLLVLLVDLNLHSLLYCNPTSKRARPRVGFNIVDKSTSVARFLVDRKRKISLFSGRMASVSQCNHFLILLVKLLK